ncbi:hypothetical protein HUK65_06005 [Rhodobacteraceae bacterium 2376]|uniref:Uncharacterized protein n=1 Tax=Rhabdonatronobacter sediminivivens TaxID=2743469 RepID=A0A7Z0HYB0_9RHOB|nr:dockerin type I domain-containing protein [Rhabdonatronobacter sediminivivens]NYS24541.1 hypothetical protein [Rhabdonatronobacter sediminivivens]
MTYHLFPSGAPFAAHVDLAGDQITPQAARLADGGMIVVFAQRLPPDTEDGRPDHEIVAQRYDSAGAPDGGLQVIERIEDQTGVGLRYPVVTGLDDGGYVIAWAGFSSDGTARDHAHVNTYDADGALVNADLAILPTRTVTSALFGWDVDVQPLADPASLSLTSLDTGGFALTWNGAYVGEQNQFAGARSAFTQTFDANGTAIAAPVQVTPWEATVSFAQDRMDWVESSAPLADGQYVVVFRGGDNHPDNPADMPGILARIMDANGTPVTDSFLVNEQLVYRKAAPAVDTLADGSFVVTWSDAGAFGPDSSTYWRRFDAEGTPLTPEQSLGARFAYQEVVPMEDGGFMLVLTHVGNPSARSSALRIDAEGNQVGEIVPFADARSDAGARNDLGMGYFSGPVDLIPLQDGPMLGVWQAHHPAGTSELGWDVILRPFAPDLLGTAGDDVLEAGAVGMALFGRQGDDVLIGGPGDDFLVGGPGDDLLQGGGGVNTAVFSGQQGDYDIARGPGGTLIVTDLREDSPDGTDTLEDIAFLQFSGWIAPRIETVAVADLELDVTLSGQVTSAQGQPMEGVTLTLMAEGWPDQTATSDAGGMFGFSLANGIGARLEAARDHDPATDGRPTAMDALEVLRMAVGLNPSFGPAQAQTFIAADVNGDGQITAQDALEVLRAAVGLASDNAPRWVFVDSATDWEALEITRSNVQFDTGIAIAAGDSDLDLGLTGILLGNMAEV